jgi:hypothetical protein
LTVSLALPPVKVVGVPATGVNDNASSSVLMVVGEAAARV